MRLVVKIGQQPAGHIHVSVGRSEAYFRLSIRRALKDRESNLEYRDYFGGDVYWEKNDWASEKGYTIRGSVGWAIWYRRDGIVFYSEDGRRGHEKATLRSDFTSFAALGAMFI